MKLTTQILQYKSNLANNNDKSKRFFQITRLSSVTLVVLTMGLTGCQTLKSFGKSDKNTVVEAKFSENVYYQNAIKQINDRNYIQAANSLKELRIFFPTSAYAKQALLDLMYVEYMQDNYDEAIIYAERFINLYPSHPQADYAYYLLGVANMTSAEGTINLFSVDKSSRDTAYYQLAYVSFTDLVNKYPNSIYVPDTAQRMTYLYNQLAKHEIHAARWYVKREAYMAAAKRAQWVFQNYPQSESIPEAIATLGYSYQVLGMKDLAAEYKTLLRINYPNWLVGDKIQLVESSKGSIIKKVSFGKLGQPKKQAFNDIVPDNKKFGTTKPQQISDNNQLIIPKLP